MTEVTLKTMKLLKPYKKQTYKFTFDNKKIAEKFIDGFVLGLNIEGEYVYEHTLKCSLLKGI